MRTGMRHVVWTLSATAVASLTSWAGAAELAAEAVASAEEPTAAGMPPTDGVAATGGAEADAKPAAEEEGPIGIDMGVPGLLVTPSGQYLLRYRHNEGKDFGPGTTFDYLTHRARLGLGAMWKDKVGVFAQLQDVRIWGSELPPNNTLFDYSAAGLDMHQAYARVKPFPEFEVRLGRQEIAYENHRLIGTVGWIEQARSFDAVRFMFKKGIVSVDSFYAKVQDEFGSPPSDPQDPTSDPVVSRDVDVLAGNMHLAFHDAFELGLIGVGDFGPMLGNPALGVRDLYTFGGIATGNASGFKYSAEGYGQLGKGEGETSYGAFMFAGMAQYTIDVATKPYIRGFGEWISGDADPTDNNVKTFHHLYATAHKFHGEMDFFLVLPANTAGRGLLDAGGALGLSPVEDMKIEPNYHYFRATADQGDDLSEFGHEIDIKWSYKPWKYLKLDLVYGLFLPGDIMKARAADPTDPKAEHFVYSTVDASF